MKTLAILLLAALPAMAQKPDELTQLKNENATLRIQITNLQSALTQREAQEIGKNLSEAHAKAIHDLETLNPGMKWDEQQGKLVIVGSDEGTLPGVGVKQSAIDPKKAK